MKNLFFVALVLAGGMLFAAEGTRDAALDEMLTFARAAEKELKHTPTCGEKQSTFGSGDATPRAVRTALCTMSVFETLGTSGRADAAHWEKLAAEITTTLFFAAETSLGKSKEVLFKCFDGHPWGALGLMGFTEDFVRLEDADPFMKGNPRPLTVRKDPAWFPGVAEAELPVVSRVDRDARRAERAYRASCAYRRIPYVAPGRDVRTGGFVGLVRGENKMNGWYDGKEFKLDTQVVEAAPMGEGERANTVLRRQLRVRKIGPKTALVREKVFVLKDCELPRGLLAIPYAEGFYRLVSGTNRRVEGNLPASANEVLYDVTYAVDAEGDAKRLASCDGMSMKNAYVTEPNDETEYWQDRIDAASQAGGGRIVIPAGAHKVAELELKNNVTLELAEGATLFAVTNGTAYRWTPWLKAELQETGVVVAYGATNIALVGKGTIDGCGDQRPFFRSDEVRWRDIYMRDCKGVRIEGVKLDHPSFWTIFLRACDGVHLKGVTSRASANLNNDGMDLCVANALIEDCDIDSEDDALVLKGFDHDFISENVEIRNCRIATTGNCIKFGTETFSKCRNYNIHHCSIGAANRYGPRAPNFVRYPMMVTNEYWCEGGLVFLMVDGGTIENVKVHDIEMRGGVRIPFAVRQGHRYGEENWNDSFIRGITLERIKMTVPAACGVGNFISGIAGCDVEDVTIRDSHFIMRACPAGVGRLLTRFPENARRYPSPGMFDGALPGYFLYATHAKNVRLENVKVDLVGEGEKRPQIVTDNPGEVTVDGRKEGVFERPEISWSIMHPTAISTNYMARVVAKAKEYGGVDSFEVCGDCHRGYSGLNGLSMLEKYPHAHAAVDAKAVEKNRREMNAICEMAHAAGKPLYYWHREIFIPEGLLKDLPQLLDEKGEFNLLGSAYQDYLRYKLDETFRHCPGLDGIVLTLTEADYSVIHNSNPARYPPQKVVEELVGLFAEEHEKRGKRFILRSFGSNSQDYIDIIGGAKRAAAKHGFEIETKVTEADFVPWLPKNPFLRKNPPLTLGAECDALGEYLSAGYLPAAQVDRIRDYVASARAEGCDRYTIRIDRVGNSIFDTAHEVNLAAYMRFIHDPDATADQVRADYAKKRFGAAANEMAALMKDELEMIRNIHYVASNLVFHSFPLKADFKTVKAGGIFSVYRENASLAATKDIWSILSDHTAPTHAQILAEKAKGRAMAEAGLSKIESLKGKMPSDEYRRQHRAFVAAVTAAKALDAFARCCVAYFEDMAARRDEPEQLTAASAHAVRIIESLMTDPKDNFTGREAYFSVVGDNLDRVYLAGLRFYCKELLNEYACERTLRKKLEARSDVLDFVTVGGIYDDNRTIRTMHGAYTETLPGRVVRQAGNPIFPNGTIAVAFKDVAGAKVELLLDPTGAQEADVREEVSNGIRRVTVGKKGRDYPRLQAIALVRQ